MNNVHAVIPDIRNRTNDPPKVRFAARLESAAERTFSFRRDDLRRLENGSYFCKC